MILYNLFSNFLKILFAAIIFCSFMSCLQGSQVRRLGDIKKTEVETIVIGRYSRSLPGNIVPYLHDSFVSFQDIKSGFSKKYGINNEGWFIVHLTPSTYYLWEHTFYDNLGTTSDRSFVRIGAKFTIPDSLSCYYIGSIYRNKKNKDHEVNNEIEEAKVLLSEIIPDYNGPITYKPVIFEGTL